MKKLFVICVFIGCSTTPNDKEVAPIQKQRGRQLRICYDKSSMVNPQMEADVVVETKLSGTGTIQNTLLREDLSNFKYEDPAFKDCIIKVVNTWKLDAKESKSTTGFYRVRFELDPSMPNAHKMILNLIRSANVPELGE